jgi:protein N-terminal methyltransferase
MEASDAGRRLIDDNQKVLAHILAIRDETLRKGIRGALFPALAAAGWHVDDAIEALWAGRAVDDACGANDTRDAHSAFVVGALGEIARAGTPEASQSSDLAFSFVRNPLSKPAVPVGGAAGEHRADAAVGAGDGVDYDFSKQFWTTQPPTVSAMLGGLDQTHAPDVAGSLRFLARLGYAADVTSAHGGGRALDCGAGIGRVARQVLLERFGIVDLVEQDARFLEQAARELPADRVGSTACAGLQLVALPLDARGPAPAAAGYGVVWVQWVLNYLTDGDLVDFMRRAAAALDPAEPRACVIVKETHTREGAADWIDSEDASVCRTRHRFEEAFAAAGLEIRAEELEQGMPQGMLPVRMWALAPASAVSLELR